MVQKNSRFQTLFCEREFCMAIHGARVVVTDCPFPSLEIERELLEPHGVSVEFIGSSDPAALANGVKGADVILTNWAPVNATVIESAGSQLKLVGRLGTGLDNIDLQTARRLGVMVTNVPDYCTPEVAEQTFALLLGVVRKVARFHLETKQGRYDLVGSLPLGRLAGRTLGIIGFGKIGRRVASIARAFDMRVVVTVRSTVKDVPDGITVLSLADLVATSDIVTLHLPLSPESQHMINDSLLSQFRRGSVIINTARGGLIDNDALTRALDAGILSGAGLDVQTPEPPPLDQRPWNDPRVVVSPHAAFLSTDSLDLMRRIVVRQTLAVLAGQRPDHVVVG
ncbi:MAG: C-terminal binding protein [Planctomycetota bacterium]|jgi:D-3-phosphoglycerate dehydrogenase / 2-oxoglutarate reductase|nr:MAG: C-terminal binding protein [Planctomycetota bacterium]RLS58933.1 MAG: C-terminal binding protein [Planctomycetota bacterium]